MSPEDYFKEMITRRSHEKVLEDAKKVLCIQPHPDDADFGAGGTIAKLTKKGCEVIYVSLMDGSIGTFKQDLWPEKLAGLRVKEQEKAAEILGVKRLIWLGYRDSELYPSLELRGKLIRIIRETRPDVVMTNDPWLPYEAHPDHRYTGLMAAEAVLFSPFPHVNPEQIREGLKPFRVPHICLFFTHRPNTYIDISETIDLKIKAILAHKTQIENAKMVSIALRAYGKELGKNIGVDYAEAFKILTSSHLHANPFTENL